MSKGPLAWGTRRIHSSEWLVRTFVPNRLWFADGVLTASARMLFRRVGFVLLVLIGMLVSLAVLSDANWEDVLAGAVIGWATSGLLWAFTSYKSERDLIMRELRMDSEYEVLHARLNHLADALGKPLVKLGEGELQDIVSLRQERNAHLSGLEEFRAPGRQEGWSWWDNVASGYPSEPLSKAPSRKGQRRKRSAD